MFSNQPGKVKIERKIVGNNHLRKIYTTHRKEKNRKKGNYPGILKMYI